MDISENIPEYCITDREHEPNIVNEESLDPGHYLPEFALKVSRAPLLDGMSFETGVHEERPEYTFTVSWTDRTRGPAMEWCSLNEKKLAQVLVAPLAQCNGPCSLSFPSTQLVEFGRCEHYVCTKCIKNSANPDRCPNDDCLLVHYSSALGESQSFSSEVTSRQSELSDLMIVYFYIVDKDETGKKFLRKKKAEVSSKCKLSKIYDSLVSITKGTPRRISYTTGNNSHIKEMARIDANSFDGRRLSALASDENTFSFGIEL